MLRHRSCVQEGESLLANTNSHITSLFTGYSRHKINGINLFTVKINCESKRGPFHVGRPVQRSTTASLRGLACSAAQWPQHKHQRGPMQMATLTQGQSIRLQHWQPSPRGPTPHHYINPSAFKSNSSTSIACYCGAQTWPRGPIDAHIFLL